MKKVRLFEQFINEAKYNTVAKVVKVLGKRPGPSIETLVEFIKDNYEDVTGVKQGKDFETEDSKIADLVGFYGFDGDEWEEAWKNANK